jgi:hypothetical protein
MCNTGADGEGVEVCGGGRCRVVGGGQVTWG